METAIWFQWLGFLQFPNILAVLALDRVVPAKAI